MIRFDVLQGQWLILALIGGAALTLLVVLAYVAAWRPRDARNGDARSRKGAFAWIPWVLILVYAGMSVWAILYTITMALHPPNW